MDKKNQATSTIVITITTLFDNSIFYKPSETYVFRSEKGYLVSEEIERFLKKIGKKLSKNEGRNFPLSKIGEE